MSKIPTRSPSHREIEFSKLAGYGLDLDDVAEDGVVTLGKLIELSEDRGPPPSHYIAALSLASEYALADGEATTTITTCAGKCQSWGALDVIDHLVEGRQTGPTRYRLAVSSCLDQCDKAAVVRIDGPSGTLLVTEASPRKLDEAIAALES